MAGVQGSQALIPVDTSVISREPTGIESSLLVSLLRKRMKGITVRIMWAMAMVIHHAFIMFFNAFLYYSCAIYIHSILSRLLTITNSFYSGLRAHTSRVLEFS
jgi:hypothetical protein